MKALLDESDLVFCVETVVPAHPASLLSGSKARVAYLGEDPLHTPFPTGASAATCRSRAPSSLRSRCSPSASRARFPRDRAPRSQREWAGRNAKAREELRAKGQATGAKARIESAWVGHELNAVLPDGAIVVDETITHRHDVLRQLEKLAPGRLHLGELRCLGMGIAPRWAPRSRARTRQSS